MAIHIELLACKFISEKARQELKRAHVEIHREVPGLDPEIEMVVLEHSGPGDRTGMYQWDVPIEIQIASRGLYLSYRWKDEVSGYALRWLDEDEEDNLDDLDDLDDHPF